MLLKIALAESSEEEKSLGRAALAAIQNHKVIAVQMDDGKFKKVKIDFVYVGHPHEELGARVNHG